MKEKTVISLLLMMTLMFTLISTAALADAGYSYIDENGTAQTTGEQVVTAITSDTATLTNGWYVVNADVTRTATITVSGDVKLILVDGKTLTVTASSESAGINVTGANSLTIYGQADGTGALKATGSDLGAGIGGGHSSSGGTITINGGHVTATGGESGAGIGSGGTAGGDMITNGGNITITGGTIKATGREYGAGIGGGMYASGGNITITGGSVTATSSGSVAWGGTGIGGGYDKGGGNIDIRGGTVVATGRTSGAGIGGSGSGDGGIITISGGTVMAKGGDSMWGGSAGIGCGPYTKAIGGTVTISGGVVFAQAGPGAKDIGGGRNSVDHGTLEISNTAAVFLKNNSCAPPTTTTQANCTVSGHIANAAAYGIPVPWSGNFGAYLRLYTLSYDANNGSGTAPSQVTQHIGTSVSVARRGTLNRTGYTFSGWNTAANKEGSGYNVGDTFTFRDDTMLYAAWTPYTYTISYHANGGTGSTASSRHTYDVAKTLTFNGFTKIGYTFVGWSTDSGGTVAYSNGQSVTNLTTTDRATVTLVAVWRPHTYTVSYDANGGTGSTAPSRHTYGEAKTLTTNNFTRVGYTFAGWATKAGGTVAYTDEENAANLTPEDGATVILYAVWTPHTYTVSYDANGGTGSTDSSSHTYDVAKALTTSSFTRKGYTFAGWATEAGVKVAYTDEESVFNLASEDGATVTLYATWAPHTYTVEYHANGGMGTTASSNHTYDETKTLTACNFTRTGYTFAGWATEAGGTVAYTDEENAANLTPEDGATVILYAVWTPHTYAVSYNANGGTGRTDSSSHTYDEVKTLTTSSFTRVGYTFAGWATEVGGAVAYADEENAVNLTPEDGATVTLYAVWTPHIYAVSYNANGGTGRIESSSHTYDEAKTLTTNNFTRVGYTFAGWATKAGGTVAYTDEENAANLTPEDGATVILYAVWTPHTYAVSYNANGGTGSTDSSNHTYDEVKTLTTSSFTRVGYTFAGWATEVCGAVAYADEENAVNLTPEDGATVTLYAVWTPHIYAVSYNANGGTGSADSSSHTYDVAKTLTPNRFTKTGYTFVGWATSPDGTVVYSDAQSVLNLTAEDDVIVKLHAVWEVNSYKVSYHANGGTGRTASSSHTYDVAKTLTANGFKRTGYTFLGWAASSNGATIYKNEESVSNLTSENDETLTIYAVWKGNSYTVNYDANGGMGNVDSSRHTYGIAKALTANGFLRTGYVFSGWATSPDGAVVYSDGQDIMNLTSINGTTVTLYAVWTPMYSLSVVGGTGSGSYAATTRVSIAADEAPSGKVFDRWISSNGGTFDDATHVSTTFTMPDQDVIVTATYRDVAILPTPSDTPPGKLDPISIQVDEATGSMLISINMASLPAGTTAIKLPYSKIITIDANTSVLKLQLSQDEWEKYEHLVLVALNDEHIPLGSYVIDLSMETWKNSTSDHEAGIISILIWIVAGVLAIGGAMTTIFILLRKKKR